jgi:hypothetical protein
MNTQNFTVRRVGASFFALLLLASGANADTITWGPASNITGDSDVSTTGNLVGAFNLGDAGVSSTTVNGVTFQGLAAPFTQSSTGAAIAGGVTFKLDASGLGFLSLPNGSYGSGVAPFTGLGSGYQTLLGSAAQGLSGDNMTLTITDLTAGQLYQFEWWSSFSAPGTASHSAIAGNTVLLSDNTTTAEGGLGQFAIGTFAAGSTSQVITFSGTGGGLVNGFELRDLGPAPAAPLPSTFAMGGVFLSALGAIAAGRKFRGRVLAH